MFKRWTSLFGLVAVGVGLLSGRAGADQDGAGLTLIPNWGEDAALGLAPAWSRVIPGDGELVRGPNPASLMSVATLDVAAAEGGKSDAKNWTLMFELPIWLSGLNGTVGARGVTVPTNATFCEILSNTDSIVGLGGRMEVDYGRWIFYMAGLYMKLSTDDIPVGPTRENVISELGIADAGIMYRFWTWNLGDGGGDPTLDVAGGAGARYMHVGLSVDTVNGGGSRNQNMDWADPLAVGQLTLDLDKHWQILARGDIGGGSSDLTWAGGVFLNYWFRFPNDVSLGLKLGYQAISEDYTNGSGSNQGTWDVIMHGPMFIISLSF